MAEQTMTNLTAAELWKPEAGRDGQLHFGSQSAMDWRGFQHLLPQADAQALSHINDVVTGVGSTGLEDHWRLQHANRGVYTVIQAVGDPEVAKELLALKNRFWPLLLELLEDGVARVDDAVAGFPNRLYLRAESPAGYKVGVGRLVGVMASRNALGTDLGIVPVVAGPSRVHGFLPREWRPRQLLVGGRKPVGVAA